MDSTRNPVHDLDPERLGARGNDRDADSRCVTSPDPRASERQIEIVAAAAGQDLPDRIELLPVSLKALPRRHHKPGVGVEVNVAAEPRRP